MFKMMSKTSLFAVAALSCLSLAYAEPATAGTIISMDLGNSTALPSNGSTFAGVESAAWWNNPNGTPNFTNVTLKDNTGTDTTAKASSIILYGNATTSPAPGGSDNNTIMYTRLVYMRAPTLPSPSYLKVDNLPTNLTTSGYDVIVYVGTVGNTSDGYRLEITDGTTTLDEWVWVSGSNYTGTFVQATGGTQASPAVGNYVRFTGLTGSSFTFGLAQTQSGLVTFLGVTGMQIVEVPEPATLGLMAVGGLLMLSRKR
ncbi:MAG: PEP-CTERM sorting domain-containing protein [Phycisphaerales bacterium]